MANLDKSSKGQLAEQIFRLIFTWILKNLCSKFPVFKSHTSQHPKQSSFSQISAHVTMTPFSWVKQAHSSLQC